MFGRSPVVVSGLALACAASIAVTSAVARADVPPPNDYVEQCTEEIQCPGAATVCAVYHGVTNETCAQAQIAAGKEERCRSWGATTSTAFFCPKDSPKPTGKPTSVGDKSGGVDKASAGDKTGVTDKKGKSGCASCTIGGSNAGASFAVLWPGVVLGLLAFARRSRRPSR